MLFSKSFRESLGLNSVRIASQSNPRYGTMIYACFFDN